MEVFIKKVASIVSDGNTDTKTILTSLHNWKADIDEFSILQKALSKISAIMYGSNSSSIGKLLVDMEQRIGETQELIEFTKAIEAIFHQPMSSQLLDEISDCAEFRNILTPYIVKYTELLGETDSAKCLDEIVAILQQRADR